MRNFDTGATRDTQDGKLQYEGYLSPIVLHRFGQYMLAHQTQRDGQPRSADNWQKGIPVDAYMDSLLRHVMDVWLHHRDRGDLATEDYEESLCAVLFNVQGLLYEHLEGFGKLTEVEEPKTRLQRMDQLRKQDFFRMEGDEALFEVLYVDERAEIVHAIDTSCGVEVNFDRESGHRVVVC